MIEDIELRVMQVYISESAFYCSSAYVDEYGHKHTEGFLLDDVIETLV